MNSSEPIDCMKKTNVRKSAISGFCFVPSLRGRALSQICQLELPGAVSNLSTAEIEWKIYAKLHGGLKLEGQRVGELINNTEQIIRK